MIKRKFLVTILALVVLLTYTCGCVEIEDYSQGTPFESIEVSGIDQDVTISSDKPVKLEVSGICNCITVAHNVTIMEIRMSGIDNTVYIPESTNPEVEISGVDNEVIRY